MPLPSNDGYRISSIPNVFFTEEDLKQWLKLTWEEEVELRMRNNLTKESKRVLEDQLKGDYKETHSRYLQGINPKSDNYLEDLDRELIEEANSLISKNWKKLIKTRLRVINRLFIAAYIVYITLVGLLVPDFSSVFQWCSIFIMCSIAPFLFAQAGSYTFKNYILEKVFKYSSEPEFISLEGVELPSIKKLKEEIKTKYNN